MNANEVRDFELNEEDTQRGRFLTFALGEDEFGMEIQYVTEIIGMQPITGLPEAPPYIKGIINLRGKIIPVMDMRIKFNKPTIEYNDRTCIVVVEVQDLAAGLIVDNVAEVLTIEPENILPPPNTGSKETQSKYVSGIGKVGNEVKLLLDCERIFQESEAAEHAAQ